MGWQTGWNKWKWVLFFLAPSLIGLSIFLVVPILTSFALAFHDWNLLRPPKFIGIANFQEMIADSAFWNALRYTLLFIVLYIPLVFVLALGLAVLLNQKLRGVLVVRTATFLPVVASWVVVSLMWKWIFNPQYGLINPVLSRFGIDAPAWLFEPNSALVAIVITSVWKDLGYIAVMYLGGLQAINDTLYEAAKIDGANARQQFFRITLPLLTPTMFFILIILLINSFQVFDQVWLMPMRDSAADRQVEVLVTEVVKNAFSYNRMGYASAMSWVLFALIFAITFVQLRLQKRWVYYDLSNSASLAAVERANTRSRSGFSLRRALLYLLMIALVALMVVPFAWMLSTSLKAQQYILETPPQLLPNPLTFESYTGLAERIDLPRVVFNSVFVAVASTVGQIIIAAMAAYAFSRLQWRGRNVVFTLYLATMMVPSVVMVIPQFVLIRQLGWVNTYAALIVPSLFNAFGTFLLRQSFLGLPKDFEEAAYVDGANPFTIFFRIILPLNMPAIATLTVLSFMGSWNSYLFPLFVARKEEVMTLPVALGMLQGGPRALTEWNLVMAGAVITVLPILIVYLLAQKWFVQGIVSSGIKG